MSLPRPILAGVTYMVTRRVSQGEFQLLPSALINQIVLYCVAVAAKKTGVIVHGICALSNHIHLNVSDPLCMLPEFSYILFKYTAKCINAHRGRWENLWAGGTQPSYVRLEDDDAKLGKMAYVVANPVEAALVRQAKHWPGVNLWHPGTYKARRPEVFFQDEGPMPTSIKLKVEPIPLDAVSRPREIMELVGQAIARREKELRAKHKGAGRTYLGLEGVRRQKPTDSPRKRMPRRRLSPRVATWDKWRRIESLQSLASYSKDYRAAFLAWQSGDRGVVFPAGVYKMRIDHCVQVADT